MKNFSWKQYLSYILLTLVLLPSIIANVYFIPKYFITKQTNSYEGSYNVTILGQNKDFSVYFTKGLNVKNANTLGQILSQYPNDFGLAKSTWGNFLNAVGKINLAGSKEEYFSIQSGDNNKKDAANIHPDCRQLENNSCSVGVDSLTLVPNTNYVFRFVITKI